MKAGDYSQPLRSPSGFHILKLNDKRDTELVLIEQTHARHILIQPNEITDNDAARVQLQDIRKQIIDGADFAELAKQHSTDPGSKGLGGDLGWFEKGKMVAEFQQVVDNTAEGEISAVFQSPFGWHIVQVLGRRTEDETEETKREKIRSQLEAQKKNEVLELWQRRLRDEAYVKIHDS
jgi:peptidyl-prolyl cis-trans isomerase SurA